MGRTSRALNAAALWNPGALIWASSQGIERPRGLMICHCSCISEVGASGGQVDEPTPVLLASAVPELCPKCRREIPSGESVPVAQAFPGAMGNGPLWRAGRGCNCCAGGYAGFAWLVDEAIVQRVSGEVKIIACRQSALTRLVTLVREGRLSPEMIRS